MATDRLHFTPLPGSESLFTPEFCSYLLTMQDRFTPRLHALREARGVVLRAAHAGRPPGHLPSSDINTGAWQVPLVPEELRRPGIEISGPVGVTPMFINALNPGPDGTRAEGDLDDDEDSAGHRLADTIQAALNRKEALDGSLSYVDPERNREYRVQPGEIPFFMHRERGLHLDEPEVTVDGKPISASILGACLTLFHAGEAHVATGRRIYFYLPKMEAATEAAWWRDFFAASQEVAPHLRDATIRAIALVESLPAAYQMEEILHALGEYGAGLNAARWDFKASLLEFVMNDPHSVWPDRFGVDIKQTPFLTNIFRRLVAVCLKHNAVPIGGMATALPSRDPEVNQQAAASIRADKEWEAQQGFLRGWVAHIFHMKTAADPFQQLRASGWTPTAEMANPDNYPIRIEVPEGPITVEGTHRNVRMLLEYLEGWLRGRGAKGIDSLAGKPGKRPALMEDLATARISVAQVAQRILHGAKDTGTGEVHTFALAKRVVDEELRTLLDLMAAGEIPQPDADTAERYRQARRIALRWIKNYTELNFRSLGSYTHADLLSVAAEPDAF